MSTKNKQSDFSTNSLHDEFSNEVNRIVEFTREQQMTSSEEIQENLSVATSNISDAKRLKDLFSNAEKLQQAAKLGISNLQVNIKKYKQIIEKMEKECHHQQVATDMQVVSAMQKAISAMAQAQNALMQSQSVDKIFDSITKCQDSLSQIEKKDQN